MTGAAALVPGATAPKDDERSDSRPRKRHRHHRTAERVRQEGEEEEARALGKGRSLPLLYPQTTKKKSEFNQESEEVRRTSSHFIYSHLLVPISTVQR